MKKVVLGAFAAAVALAAGPAFAADAVTLQLKWVTQAQFGGYYVAKDKGFYADEGLDVTIKPGGPDIAPETGDRRRRRRCHRRLDGRRAGRAREGHHAGQHRPALHQGRHGAGLPEIYRHQDARADFKGKTLGVWFFGNEYPFYAWMHKLGLSTDGGPDGVTVLKQSFDVQPLIQKQADCISVMTYNEYGQVLDAGFKPDDLTVFNYSAMGNDLLEDGLYVLEDKLKDPAFKDKMVRFVKASMKGWDYALGPPGRVGPDRRRQWRPGPRPPDLHDGRGRQADRRRQRRAQRGRLSAHRAGAARPEDHHQEAGRRLDPRASPTPPA